VDLVWVVVVAVVVWVVVVVEYGSVLILPW
jgi:hypothetical protein